MAETNNPLQFLRSRKALIVSGILLAQSAIFYGFSRPEHIPESPSLSSFPLLVGPWGMVQQGYVDEDTKQVLNADDLLTREYARPGDRKSVSLFIAAFKSQRNGKAPHSPKNCLPGSGWTQLVNDQLPIELPDGKRIVVNHYIVAKTDAKSNVLYWYQSRDRSVAGEFTAKMFVIADAIRYNRTDTALVRVVSPGDDEAATQSVVQFVKDAFPTIRQFLPQ